MKASRHASITQQKLALQQRVAQMDEDLKKLNAESGHLQTEIYRIAAERSDVQARQREVLEKFNRLAQASMPKLEAFHDGVRQCTHTATMLAADAELLRGMFLTQTQERERISEEASEVMRVRRRLQSQ